MVFCSSGELRISIYNPQLQASDFLIPKVINLALQAIINVGVVQDKTPTDLFDYVYASTTPGSAIRRYLVESNIHRVHPPVLHDNYDEFPKEMFKEIAICAMEHIWEEGPANDDFDKDLERLGYQDYMVPEDEG